MFHKKSITFCILLILLLFGCRDRETTSSTSVITSSTIEESSETSTITSSISEESSISSSYNPLDNFLYEIIENQVKINGLNDYTVLSLDVPSVINDLPVVEISKGAFSSCSNLESITIPFVGATPSGTGTTNTYFGYIFGANTYNDNDDAVPTSLKSVVITGGTTINSYAFYYCTDITSISISSTVTDIKLMALAGCSSIDSISVDINNPVYKTDSNCIIKTSTNDLIFGCKTSVIPSYVEKIVAYSFYECSSLSSITIPSSVKYIDYSVFYNCKSLTSLIIPNSVLSVGQYCFRGCSNLESISFGSGVTSIGLRQFLDCDSLSSITVDVNNTSYKGEGNCLIQTSNNSLISGCKTSIIPAYVESIEGGAFAYCNNLISIVIPSSVTSLGTGIFSDCALLTSIIIKGNIATIPTQSFYHCSSLTSIVIPSSVTTIGSSAFSGCSSIGTVYYGGTSTTWNSITITDFNTNSNLTSASRYYFLENEPTLSGNYWHYVSDVPTKW